MVYFLTEHGDNYAILVLRQTQIFGHASDIRVADRVPVKSIFASVQRIAKSLPVLQFEYQVSMLHRGVSLIALWGRALLPEMPRNR
jgi:hypothetical protein